MNKKKDILDALEEIGRALIGEDRTIDPKTYQSVAKVLIEIYTLRMKKGELSEEEISEILSIQGFDLEREKEK